MSQHASPADHQVISRGQWNKDASKEDIQIAIDQIYEWLNRSIDQGQMRMGSRLARAGVTVSRTGVVMDGPFGEVKEVIGGYWFIVASSLEEAARLAEENPCLKYGIFCEIRPTDPETASAFKLSTETPR